MNRFNMKVLLTKVLFVILCCLLITQPSLSQTINQSNYKNYAHCEETVINGKTYSTFGEGRCPAGSNRSSYNKYSYLDPVNAQSMRQMDAQVQALGQAQQAVVAYGQARAAKQRQEAWEISTFLWIDLSLASMEEDAQLYEPVSQLLPVPGAMAIAKVGESLVQVVSGFNADCIVPLFEHSARKMGGWIYEIFKDEPACKLEKKTKNYTPVKLNVKKESDNSPQALFPIRVKEKKGKYKVCFFDFGFNFACKKGVSSDQIKFVRGFVGDRRAVIGELFFQGFENAELIFEYMERDESGSMNTVKKFHVTPSQSRYYEGDKFHFEVLEWDDTSIVARITSKNMLTPLE